VSITTKIANYSNDLDKSSIEFLLDSYARDDMGGGQPLDKKVKDSVVNELAKIPHAFSVLAYSDGESVGLANCFESFSTFMCKPIVNIHDLVVTEGYRRSGISQLMLDKIVEIALTKGCCKVTLEVLGNNEAAKSAYSKFGFEGYRINQDTGIAQYWQKII
jgi:ribosomal protein S18 acetylase RimI-like enzyme